MSVKNKILVTGSSGFIGSELCTFLESKNEIVIRTDSAKEKVQDRTSFEKYSGQEIKHVFHLASRTFVPASWEQPLDFFEVNVTGTANVLDFCRKNNIPLTYVSAYIYGEVRNNPISESTPVNPNNPYALSKKLAEDLCLFYSDYYKMKISIVRPFNVYGPGQNSSFLIPYVIDQAIHNSSIKVKDLVPKRDYIFLSDLVELIYLVFFKNAEGIFNAGSGTSFSVQHVVDTVQKVLGKSLPVHSEQQVRVNEISDTVADISRAKKILGWSPSTRLEEGIRIITERTLRKA
jgi:nucleoside-diphosphate-sugar epimerase